MAKNRPLANNILLSAGGNLVAPIVALITAPLLAYGLGVTGRGALAAATAPLLLAVNAATLGLPDAVAHFTARRPQNTRVYLWIGTGALTAAGIMSTAAMWIAAPLLSGGNHQLAELIRLCSVACAPSLAIGAARGVAMGQERWGLVNAERAGSALLRAIVLIVLALSHALTITAAMWTIAISSFIGGIAYAPTLLAWGRRTAGNDSFRSAGGELLGYGGRVWLGSLTGIVLLRLDQTVMVPLSSERQLGLYVAAVTLAELTTLTTNAVRDVMVVRDTVRQDAQVLTSTARGTQVVAIVVGIVVAASASLLLRLLYGSEFMPALPSTEVLILATSAGAAGSVAGAGLSARGRPGLRSLSLLIAATANVLVLFILVPHLGALGAALATLLGNLLAANSNIIFMRLIFGVPIGDFYRLRSADVARLYTGVRSLIVTVRARRQREW